MVEEFLFITLLVKYILCWVRSVTQIILTNQLLHWHVHLFIGNGHVAQTDFMLTKDFEIDWQNVTSRHVHFNRCIYMGNLDPIQKGPQFRVHVSHGEVAAVVLFWNEYDKDLMWQKRKCCWVPGRTVQMRAGERIMPWKNSKSQERWGSLFCCVQVGKHSTPHVWGRLVQPSDLQALYGTHFNSSQCKNIHLKSPNFLSVHSDTCLLALVDAKEQSLAALWVTFHSLKAFMILHKEPEFC